MLLLDTCSIISTLSSACYTCMRMLSDDMMIKLWDWDRKWTCSQVFEGHTHYVMQVVINPKDNNQFASASLDRTIKVYRCLCVAICMRTIINITQL